jgi:hypothetical protein
MRAFCWLVVGGALLGTAAVPAVAASLVKNGSFETPVVPDGGYTTYGTGSSFTGWTVVGDPGNVAIVSGDLMYCGHRFAAKKGKQLFDLTGNTNNAGATGIQQRISTAPGATYALSLFIENVYDTVSNCGTSSTVHVVVDGETIATFTNTAGKNGDLVWRGYSTQFVAHHKRTAIALINGDPPADTNNGIDAVTVALVRAP